MDVGAGVPPVRLSHGGLVWELASNPCRAALDCTSEDARAYIGRSRAADCQQFLQPVFAVASVHGFVGPNLKVVSLPQG